MSVREILRHDLLVLKKSTLSCVVVVALLLPTLGAFTWSAGKAATQGTAKGISTSMFAVLILVPITVLVAASFSIAKERETGTIHFLLAYPNNRSEILVGKMLSRTILVGLGLGIGSMGIAIAAVVLTDTPQLRTIGIFSVLTILFATAYVGLAVGISAATSSQIRAMVGVVGAYLFWSVGWLPGFPYSVSMFTIEILEGVLGGRLSHSSVVLLEILNPPTAYMQSMQLLGSTFETVARGSSTVNMLAPVWAVIIVLIAWATVPLVFGYLSFRTAEVN